ncbi:hypothetical protein ES708_12301 [subsurface metagenome]
MQILEALDKLVKSTEKLGKSKGTKPGQPPAK